MTGWTVFAAVWLLIAGSFNVITGATAVHRGNFFNHQMVVSNLSTWGWIILIVGAIQATASLLVFARNPTGNLLGLLVAMGATVLWFLFLFSAPFAALIGLLMNGMVIYGLTIGAYEE
jgi:multisubunit Na+/H+ antiporter MnhG subunit